VVAGVLVIGAAATGVFLIRWKRLRQRQSQGAEGHFERWGGFFDELAGGSVGLAEGLGRQVRARAGFGKISKKNPQEANEDEDDALEISLQELTDQQQELKHKRELLQRKQGDLYPQPAP